MQLEQFDASFDVLQQLARTKHTLYLLMDGARFKNIRGFIHQYEDSPRYFPLYRGTYFESALEVSPCLIRVNGTRTGLLPWYIETGANERKALVIVSQYDLKALGRHFQNFLEARLPSMQIVMFRFYDPGVFGALAPFHAKKSVHEMLLPCEEVYWKLAGRYNRIFQ
jgi:hypothetical protein